MHKFLIIFEQILHDIKRKQIEKNRNKRRFNRWNKRYNKIDW